MIILDFLFYYLTYWFDKNKNKLSWSTPIQRSTYAVGLMTMGLFVSANELLESGKIKSLHLHIPMFVFLLAALGCMKLYDLIYIGNDRYAKISITVPAKFKISDDVGVLISIVFLVLCTLSPFIVSTILVPFGSHTN